MKTAIQPIPTSPAPIILTSCTNHFRTSSILLHQTLALRAFVNLHTSLREPNIYLITIFARDVSMIWLATFGASQPFAVGTLDHFAHGSAFVQYFITLRHRAEKQVFIPSHLKIVLKSHVLSITIRVDEVANFIIGGNSGAIVLGTFEVVVAILVLD